MLARPFAALRPRPDTAQAVVAPPYDVIDTEEARALAAGRPESFLHISRPEIDLPPATDPYSEAVYARGAHNLAALIDAHVLERDAEPGYYIYRMTMDGRSQTGIAIAASVRAYEARRIHAHELTRPDKENDRVRNIEALNAQTGPVLLAYKANAALTELVGRHTAAPPTLTAIGHHEVEHCVWCVNEAHAVDELTEALDALGDLYIADGHHRSAAAARVAAARRSAGTPTDASHEFFLSVAFADDQMRIFDYNRVVSDLNGLGASDFLAAVERGFELKAEPGPAKPATPRTFGMYLDGQWYRLKPRAPAAADDPVARLDVSILQNSLIAPILGVADPRTDVRIGFVGGVRGLGELERRVDTGTAAVAFALHATSIHDLMAVADAGLLMPPKSTWFEPKLADGLLTHVLD
jgi:uncharacterized protein (DUF1015 family)